MTALTEAPRLRDVMADRAAAAVHKLVQSQPVSPSEADIAAAIDKAFSQVLAEDQIGNCKPATEPFEFEPILGSDGKRLSLGMSNMEFANRFCPSLNTAFALLDRDHVGARKAVVDLVSGNDGDAAIIVALLANWDVIEGKFHALADLAGVARSRVLAVCEALVDEDSEIGRALNESVGDYLEAAGPQ